MLTNRHYPILLFCRIIVFILCISLATGCTTFTPLASTAPESIIAKVKTGDTVRLTTRDGRTRDFMVKEATGEYLAGENERVKLSEITGIERREHSIGKSTALVVGTIVLTLLAFMAFYRPPEVTIMRPT